MKIVEVGDRRLPEIQVSRRWFLRASASAAAVLALAPLPPIPCAAEAGQLNPEINKESVENEFNIQLKTLREVYQEMGREFPEENNDFHHIPLAWSRDHLISLSTLLPLLPKHFYQRPESKITIILSNTNHCNDTDPDSPPGQIQLDHKKLQPESKREALEGLTHELTHAITPKELIIIPNPISPYLPGTLQIESPWFAIVDEILGGSYGEKGRELWYLVSERKRKINPQDFAKHKFYGDLLAGFNRAEDPYELIPVFAQHYLYGEGYIYQMYGEFFSQDQRDKLYSFTRDTVFQGAYYPSFPV